MSCLCCSTIFWTAEYNSPRTFCLADYSVVFCDLCLSRLSRKPVTAKTAYEPLGATPWTNTLPFLIPDNQIGFVVKSAPPVTFHVLKFPASRLVSTRSFHYIRRLCYHHRSYQWWAPRGAEQACLNEPLLADLCRHTSFGCVTTVILR